MGTNGREPMKIVRGTDKHKIYEAIMAYPKDKFTIKEIHRVLRNEGATITLAYARSIISWIFQNEGLVNATNESKVSKKTNHPHKIYERNIKAVQPIILQHKLEGSRFGRNRRKKPTTADAVKKYPNFPKTQDPIIKGRKTPNEITEAELGRTIIDYINFLKSKVESLTIALRDATDKSNTQINSLQGRVDTQASKIDKLMTENFELRNKLSAKGRTFCMEDVVRFKNSRRENG